MHEEDDRHGRIVACWTSVESVYIREASARDTSK